MRGSGNDGIKILESKADAKVTRAGIEITANHPATTAKPFPSETRYFNAFDIHWEISWDGGKSWHDAGTSSNPIYVSLGGTRT